MILHFDDAALSMLLRLPPIPATATAARSVQRPRSRTLAHSTARGPSRAQGTHLVVPWSPPRSCRTYPPTAITVWNVLAWQSFPQKQHRDVSGLRVQGLGF